MVRPKPTHKHGHMNCNECKAVIRLIDAWIVHTLVMRDFHCSETCARKQVARFNGECGTVLILPPPDYLVMELEEAHWQPIVIEP